MNECKLFIKIVNQALWYTKLPKYFNYLNNKSCRVNCAIVPVSYVEIYLPLARYVGDNGDGIIVV